MAAFRVLLLLLLITPYLSKGNEGFWLPIHLERLRGIDLQKQGLHLTYEEIYSINNSSLKDAIVSFNGSCSGAIISKSGLMLTNHHCGYEEVQQASTLKDNLIEEGFWALSREQEIPSKDSYVSFLVRMEDVTKQVLEKVGDQPNEKDRGDKIQEIIRKIEEGATDGNHYDAEVKSFFYGNEYYLFIYETYKDIRLVGTPPDNIGKFGGETDNWEWPSHTGDFALFRIYTDGNGKPATYATTNKPLMSSYQLPISLAGIEENAATMVMGYPAKTNRYSTSFGVKYSLEHIIPNKLKLFQVRKQLLSQHLKQDTFAGLRYGSTLMELNNLEKYLQGQRGVIGTLQVIAKKEKYEEKFREWYQSSPEKLAKYGEIDTSIQHLYQQMASLQKYNIFLVDGIFSSELLLFTYHFSGLYQPLAEKYPTQAFEEKITKLKALSATHFKNYRYKADQDITAAMMELFYVNIPKEQHPVPLRKLGARYQQNFHKWSESLFKHSLFTDPEKVARFLENPKFKILTKDPAFRIMRQLVEHYYGQVAYRLKEANAKLNNTYRIRQQGLSEMNKRGNHYPEANGTLRVSFGKVKPYINENGSIQPYQTTLSGMIEKTKSENPDYQGSDKLIELYRSRKYGGYGEHGDVPIAFLTDNDITGGNSGSPVLNSHGELVGLVSDSNKEALAGDFYYDKDYQRSINIDIRYILFIIDKYADAGNLIDEMSLTDISRLQNYQKSKKPAITQD